MWIHGWMWVWGAMLPPLACALCLSLRAAPLGAAGGPRARVVACAGGRAQARLCLAREQAAAAQQQLEQAYGETGDGAAAVKQLKLARERLEELRLEEAVRECEVRLEETVGGEAAAEALEELRCAGVQPDQQCFRQALATCGGTVKAVRKLFDMPGGLAEQAQWGQLILSEMAEVCTVGPDETALAVRPSVLSARWDIALKVLPVSYTHLTLPTKRIV